MTVLPVYNRILVPNTTIYLQRELYHMLAGKEPVQGERLFMLVEKKKQNWDEITNDSFYPIGMTGTISDTGNSEFIVISSGERVNIESVQIVSKYNIQLNVSRRAEIDDVNEEEEMLRLSQMKEKLTSFLAHFQWGPMLQNYMSQWNSIGEIGSMFSTWLPNSNEEKYEVLREDSCQKRTEMLEKMIYEYLEIAQLSGEAQNKQEEDYKKIYRKSAIQKQMQYLQEELDKIDPENVSDIRKFEIAIEKSGMNEEAKAEATKVVNRLKGEGQQSAETGMLYEYLDFLTSLPWKKEPAEQIDLDEAAEILEEDHFGLDKVKGRIVQQIAVMNLQKKQTGSILLFVGAPGTGKTSICQSIAKALGRKYVRVSLGGARDEADIRGHRRTYIGAMAGRIMDSIHKAGVTNPVMVLDEVDKLYASYNGDPASALLEVLDPEQNNTFTDHYMKVPYDLSDVMFICTANTTDTIPEPLLNRMEVIRFNGYSEVEKFQIARRHLLPRVMNDTGITEKDLSVPDETIRKIITDFTMEGGVRGLKKRLETLCRKAAVEIAKGRDEALIVKENELREYLDDKPVAHEHILKKKRPGIVTGLAWTQVGGEILFIETLLTKGNGKVIITGQLGDVMKESAQIAVSLVKSLFPEKAEVFKEHDLHIHVPAGAVPKDGPSAGVTLTTALASLLQERAVSPEIAMTGEVSLRGAVTPIGGLPEKLMAAVRAGIKRVFIPKENEEDLRDVPQEVKDQLSIETVETIAEVLDKTGVLTAQDCLNRVPSTTEKAVNEHGTELTDAGQNATV